MCRGANISSSSSFPPCPRPSLSFFLPISPLARSSLFPSSWPSLFRFEFNDGKCTLAKSISCSFPPSLPPCPFPCRSPRSHRLSTVWLDRRFFGRINLIKTIRYETFFIEREEWAAVVTLWPNDQRRTTTASPPSLLFHLSKNIVAIPRKSFAFKIFVGRGRGDRSFFFSFSRNSR